MESRTTGQSYRVSHAWDGNLGAERSYSYSYTAADGSLSAMNAPGGGFAYSYDGLKRLSSRNLCANDASFLTREYSYLAGAGTNGTTTLVSGVTNKKADNSTLSSYGYTYDAGGNILSVTGSDSATYTYDAQGQLLTETRGSTTVTYSYDTFGNLWTVSDGTDTVAYTYGNSDWKDLLTAYDNHTIIYDAIGNLTTWYDGATMTWTNGRRLATISATNDHAALGFTYDSDGLRLTKTAGTVLLWAVLMRRYAALTE